MRLPRFRITERQVLLWILAGLFLAYAAMFLLAGLRQRATPTEAGLLPRVRRMPAPAETGTNQPPDMHYILADLFDPSLMSLPSAHGFSRVLWLAGPAAELSATDWNIRPAFLSQALPDELAVLLAQPSATQSVAVVAEKLPATAAEAEAVAPVTATVPASNSSVATVLGALSARGVLGQLIYPVVTNAIPLRATRVRVAVAPDGAVRFANAERSCGSEAVDALAVEWSRQLQFAPLTGPTGTDRAAVQWGVVRFAWATVPPPATNGVAKTAEPEGAR